MDKIKILIDFKDKEYSYAISKAFLMLSNDIEIVDFNPDITISELSISPYQPVQNMFAQTMALMNRPTGPAKPLENVIYSGFTSAVGGSGLSTTAICYARIASRVFNRKVGFISFDPWFRQDLPEIDEFGVRYYNDWPVLDELDELVIDIYYGAKDFRGILDMCERRIVIAGFDEKRIKPAEIFLNELKESAKTYIISPLTFLFQNHYEDNVNPSDIHSQLGKEMCEFAKKLEEQSS